MALISRPDNSWEAKARDAAAKEDLQRRQRRLSSIAGAAKAEVVCLRSERARLLAQLRQLADEVAALPQPPKALAQAQAAALRCIEAEGDKHGTDKAAMQ